MNGKNAPITWGPVKDCVIHQFAYEEISISLERRISSLNEMQYVFIDHTDELTCNACNMGACYSDNAIRKLGYKSSYVIPEEVWALRKPIEPEKFEEFIREYVKTYEP